MIYQAWWALFWRGSREFEPCLVEDGDRRGNLDYPALTFPSNEETDMEFDIDAGNERNEAEETENTKSRASLDEYLTACNDFDREMFKRPERARARKAGNWLANQGQFIQGLVVTLFSIQGSEQQMYRLMKEQRLATWSGRYGVDALPLVQSATFSASPTVEVLSTYKIVMESAPDHVLYLLSGFLGNDNF